MLVQCLPVCLPPSNNVDMDLGNVGRKYDCVVFFNNLYILELFQTPLRKDGMKVMEKQAQTAESRAVRRQFTPLLKW